MWAVRNFASKAFLKLTDFLKFMRSQTFGTDRSIELNLP